MNKVVLLGRLTNDPELRYTTGETAVTRFTLAVDKRYKNKDEERKADFFKCVAFRSTAEFISKYFVKGQKILVAGQLSTVSCTNEDGKQYTLVNVVADEVYFADGKKKSDESTEIPNDDFIPMSDADGIPF